ncbi:hypothetical protein D9M68_161600 [compost metagenome]
MDYLDLLQWPAMLVTVAAWLIGSRQTMRRNLGFWVFLASNALWIAWGLGADRPAAVPGGDEHPRGAQDGGR